MEKSKSFRDWLVSQKSHQLTLHIYQLTKAFPKEEMFGLTSHIRRSAVSIPTNVTQGYGKKTKPYKARFMNIAQGSPDETHDHLMQAPDLAYADTVTFTKQPGRSGQHAQCVPPRHQFLVCSSHSYLLIPRS